MVNLGSYLNTANTTQAKTENVFSVAPPRSQNTISAFGIKKYKPVTLDDYDSLVCEKKSIL